MKVKIVLNSYLGLPVMYCLLEAVSVYPEKLATKFVDKTEWIKVCPHDMFISLRIQVFQTNVSFFLPVLICSLLPSSHFKNNLKNENMQVNIPHDLSW